MAYQVTLKNGPVSVDVQGYRFARDRAVHVSEEALALRLKGDPNFEVVSLDPAPKAPAPVAAKAKKVPPPPPPEPETEPEAEEEDDETDLDGDEEEDDDGEESAPLTRAELKSLKKADLIEIATSNSVEVSPDASKNELIDAIMEALGEEA